MYPFVLNRRARQFSCRRCMDRQKTLPGVWIVLSWWECIIWHSGVRKVNDVTYVIGWHWIYAWKQTKWGV